MAPPPLRPPPGTLPRYLLGAACLVVIVAGLKAAASFFIPVLLAFFLAVLAFPLLFWLRRKNVPAPFAVALTVLALVLVVSGVLFLASFSVNRMARVAPTYQEQFEAVFTSAGQHLAGFGIDTSNWLSEELLDFQRLLSFATDAFARVAALLSVGLLVLLITVFVFVEALGFPRKLAAALGSGNEVLERFNRINREVQRYLLIKTAVSLATGLTLGLWAWLLGLELPVFLGLTAFLLNYIPNIGSVFAAVPAVLLALLQFGPASALATATGYVVVNIVLGNLVEPNLMGRRLGLSPLVVLFSLIFWGWLWGVVGALLAVPLTMVLKILFENTEQLRWLATLMERVPAPPPKSS